MIILSIFCEAVVVSCHKMVNVDGFYTLTCKFLSGSGEWLLYQRMRVS